MVTNEISVERMNLLLKRPVDSNLPQTYMNLIPIFLTQTLPKPCLILSNWSLEIMLKAAFMKDRGSIFPPHTLSFEMLVDLTRTDLGIDLDSIALIQSVKCIANYPNHSSLQNMSSAHLLRIIRKVDSYCVNYLVELLIHLPSDIFRYLNKRVVLHKRSKEECHR